MNINIRNSVFETNSSSTHAVSICDKNVYLQWIKGEVKYNPILDLFLKTEEADEYNINNFNKQDCCGNFNLELMLDEDFKNPTIIEILLANKFYDHIYVNGYFSYKRYFAMLESTLCVFKKIEKYADDKVEFGYDGRY